VLISVHCWTVQEVTGGDIVHVSVHLLITVLPVYLRVEEGNGSAANSNAQHQLVAHSLTLGLEIRISRQKPNETSTGEILTPTCAAFTLGTNLCTCALVTALFCQLHTQCQFVLLGGRAIDLELEKEGEAHTLARKMTLQFRCRAQTQPNPHQTVPGPGPRCRRHETFLQAGGRGVGG
jgi:hypothetical protein